MHGIAHGAGFATVVDFEVDGSSSTVVSGGSDRSSQCTAAGKWVEAASLQANAHLTGTLEMNDSSQGKRPDGTRRASFFFKQSPTDETRASAILRRSNLNGRGFSSVMQATGDQASGTGAALAFTSNDAGDWLQPIGALNTIVGQASLSVSAPIPCGGGNTTLKAWEDLPPIWFYEQAAQAGGAPSTSPIFHLSEKDLRDRMRAGKPFVVEGDGRYHYVVDSTTTDYHIHVIIRVGALPYEATLEPDDAAAYKSWVPEGPRIGDASPWGNEVKLKVVLRDAKTHAPVKANHGVRWRLEDVSRQPGIAGNHPHDAHSLGNTPDLAFAPAHNSGTIDPTLQTLEQDSLASHTPAAIAAKDYGAWGTIRAWAIVDGNPIPAMASRKSGHSPTLSIPLDEDANHIADAWEDQRGILGLGLPPSWDEDAIPAGQRRNGDGYTLYEEYRGFVVLQGGAKVHVRTEWNKKDIFIWDKDGLIKKYYEPHNADAAQLELRYVNDSLMLIAGSISSPDHRVINFNTSDDMRYARQYGVIALRDDHLNGDDGKPIDGGAQLVPKGRGFFEPLKGVHEIRLNFASQISKFSGLARAPFNIPADRVSAIIEKDRESLVIHEFGHQIGIHHHFPANVTIDYRNPPRDENMKVIWPEEKAMTTQGVRNCAMRYYDAADVEQTRKLQHLTIFPRYCHGGEQALYPEGVIAESNNCYGQIDVKSDP